ncbi:hypothetical protein [Nostoc commune]|uniref:hypothetical protein n=1 Tax=Nostoc commune TaxID=1178 RepID=UPI0015E813A0|nr:hypothetical protein [Nostoc commune]
MLLADSYGLARTEWGKSHLFTQNCFAQCPIPHAQCPIPNAQPSICCFASLAI